jgi:ribonuclease HI
LLKGKSPVVATGISPGPIQIKKDPVKPWAKPPTGWVKLSIDGSFKAEDHLAGAGMVLRDELGLTIFTACHTLEDCHAPVEAELRACAEGLQMALHQSQLPIIIESDCVELVAAVNSLAPDRSPFFHWVDEIRNLANQNRQCVFIKVHRSQVRVSDFLANIARLQHCNALWLGSGPEDALQLLDLDRSVTLPE